MGKRIEMAGVAKTCAGSVMEGMYDMLKVVVATDNKSLAFEVSASA
jgi:hypothetical protein